MDRGWYLLLGQIQQGLVPHRARYGIHHSGPGQHISPSFGRDEPNGRRTGAGHRTRAYPTRQRRDPGVLKIDTIPPGSSHAGPDPPALKPNPDLGSAGRYERPAGQDVTFAIFAGTGPAPSGKQASNATYLFPADSILAIGPHPGNRNLLIFRERRQNPTRSISILCNPERW